MGLWGARAIRITVLAAVLAVVPGCAAASAAVPAVSAVPVAATVPAWPVTMAAIGHSGLRGYDADGSYADVPADSWATGTNPLVDSVYSRIVADDPALAGHAVNLAVSGSTVDGLLAQAHALVQVDPAPQLVIVQTIDNDIRCDGTDDENLPIYRQKLTEVMDTLTAGLPDASIFVVSPWARVQEWVDTVYPIDPAHLTGTGMCDTVDPATGLRDPARIAALQGIVDRYVDVVRDVCGQYPQCFTDNGEMESIDLDAADLTLDRQHLTVSGQAKMAAIAYRLLQAHYAG